jgi:hypothetical protein
MIRLGVRFGWLLAIFGAAIALTTGLLVYRQHARDDAAQVLLERADDLSWKNDWAAADPLYAEAEQLFTRQGRPSQALYAHVSRFVLRADEEEISPLLVELCHRSSENVVF